MQGTCSQEFIPNFSFSWFRLWYGSDIEWLYVHNLNTIFVQPVITSFSAGKFWQQLALSNISEQLYFEGWLYSIILPPKSAI